MNTSPFYYEQVKSPQELQRFMDNYWTVSGNKLDIAYLQAGIVYQLYRGTRPIAGFVLNTVERAPLRYLSYLDPAVRAQTLLDGEVAESDFIEIAANYSLPNEMDELEKQAYYRLMLSQAYKFGKWYSKSKVMGGSTIKQLKRIQSELMDQSLYKGPVCEAHQSDVKAGSGLLEIYYVPIDDMPWKAVIVLLKRYIFRSLSNLFKRSTAHKIPEKQKQVGPSAPRLAKTRRRVAKTKPRQLDPGA